MSSARQARSITGLPTEGLFLTTGFDISSNMEGKYFCFSITGNMLELKKPLITNLSPLLWQIQALLKHREHFDKLQDYLVQFENFLRLFFEIEQIAEKNLSVEGVLIHQLLANAAQKTFPIEEDNIFAQRFVSLYQAFIDLPCMNTVKQQSSLQAFKAKFQPLFDQYKSLNGVKQGEEKISKFAALDQFAAGSAERQKQAHALKDFISKIDGANLEYRQSSDAKSNSADAKERLQTLDDITVKVNQVLEQKFADEKEEIPKRFKYLYDELKKSLLDRKQSADKEAANGFSKFWASLFAKEKPLITLIRRVIDDAQVKANYDTYSNPGAAPAAAGAAGASASVAKAKR